MFKILCSVWKQPGEDKLCETHEVEILEEDIINMAIKKARAEKGWSESDIYNAETVHFKI